MRVFLGRRGITRVRLAGALVGLGFFLAALWMLRQELRAFTVADVIHQLRRLPVDRLWLSLAMTILGYAALTGYDALALRWLGIRLPYRYIGYASSVGWALANNVPMAFFVGGSVRYRFYSDWGIGVGDTAALVVLNLVTYTVGLLTAAALAFTLEPMAVPSLLTLPFATTLPLGLAAASLVMAYLIWSAVRTSPLRVRGRIIPAPRLSLSLCQIAISLLDWGFSGAALYVLLPLGGVIPSPAFFGVFILGQVAALIAQLPGGLGIFEAVVVATLAPAIPAPAVLGSLLAYRVVYFFIPLAAASVVLAAREITGWYRSRRRAQGEIGPARKASSSSRS